MRGKARYRVAPRVRALLLLAVIVAAGWYARHWLEANRPQDAPWTPLAISDPVGLATSYKLSRLDGDKAACLALFEDSGFAVSPIADGRPGETCGFVDGVRLERMSAIHAPGNVRLACPLAAAQAIWERHVVQTAAQRRFSTAVARIENLGTYNCRRIHGSSDARWSKHATAEAIDISAFRLADGRRIALIDDWRGSGAAAAFLREIRDGACDVFGGVLSPDYNAAHADHFHFETGALGACR